SVNLRTAAQVAETVARTIHAVHCHGFEHRNLDPSNILLSVDGGVKLIGFGFIEWPPKPPADSGTLGVSPDSDVRALGRMLGQFCAQLRQQMPPRLEAIHMRCQSETPRLRYATAQQLADDLKRFLRA